MTAVTHLLDTLSINSYFGYSTLLLAPPSILLVSGRYGEQFFLSGIVHFQTLWKGEYCFGARF
ncbi:MAG: hypothetical protein ACHQQQ_04280 [Bacteroidota bacterium]